MKLKQGEIIVLIAALGAVILSAIVHVGIREWYKPDIRYEQGSYYISGDAAVASLKIKNYGHSDAENITVAANFKSKLEDISLDKLNLTLDHVSGGVGSNNSVVKIDCLVPDQTAFLYYAVDYSTGDKTKLSESFLDELTFKGGKGKTGEPIWWILFFGIGFFIFYTVMLFVARRWMSGTKQFERHYVRISEAISIAQRAHQEGKSLEQLSKEASEKYNKISFRRKTLIQVARRTYCVLSGISLDEKENTENEK